MLIANSKPRRAYPWGDGWVEGRVNTSESDLGGPSPVGIFPEGASPYGCLDMAGNVWEWTRSLWGPWDSENGEAILQFAYPYEAKDGRENLDAGNDVLRVLRGGSFPDDQRPARCAFRFRNSPDVGYCNLGFRLAVSPSRP